MASVQIRLDQLKEHNRPLCLEIDGVKGRITTSVQDLETRT